MDIVEHMPKQAKNAWYWVHHRNQGRGMFHGWKIMVLLPPHLHESKTVPLKRILVDTGARVVEEAGFSSMSNADVSRNVQFILTMIEAGAVDTKIGTFLNSVVRGINIHVYSYYFLFKYVHDDDFRRDKNQWGTYDYKARVSIHFILNSNFRAKTEHHDRGSL